jgi:hypothetical protein
MPTSRLLQGIGHKHERRRSVSCEPVVQRHDGEGGGGGGGGGEDRGGGGEDRGRGGGTVMLPRVPDAVATMTTDQTLQPHPRHHHHHQLQQPPSKDSSLDSTGFDSSTWHHYGEEDGDNLLEGDSHSVAGAGSVSGSRRSRIVQRETRNRAMEMLGDETIPAGE